MLAKIADLLPEIINDEEANRLVELLVEMGCTVETKDDGSILVTDCDGDLEMTPENVLVMHFDG